MILFPTQSRSCTRPSSYGKYFSKGATATCNSCYISPRIGMEFNTLLVKLEIYDVRARAVVNKSKHITDLWCMASPWRQHDSSQGGMVQLLMGMLGEKNFYYGTQVFLQKSNVNRYTVTLWQTNCTCHSFAFPAL